MKIKFLYMVLFVPILLFSELNIKMVNEALLSIKSSKKKLFYYINDENLLTKLEINRVDSLKKADIWIFPENNSSKKMSIVDSFGKLRRNKNSIGAIYVKKGRTQIMFVEERLKKNGLKISKDKYRIQECHLNPVCFLGGK